MVDFNDFLEDSDFLDEEESSEDGEPRQEREQTIDTTQFSGLALNLGSATNGIIEDFKDRFLEIRRIFREEPKQVKEQAKGDLSDARSEMKARLKEFRRKVKRVIRNDQVNFEDLADVDGDVDLVRDELLEGWTQLQNIRREILQDVDNRMKKEIGKVRRDLKGDLRELNNVVTNIKNETR